jgi:hypothetical protein
MILMTSPDDPVFFLHPVSSIRFGLIGRSCKKQIIRKGFHIMLL